MKIFKLIGKLFLLSVVTALIISFYFTKDDAENLWSWFTGQLNSLSWTLIIIIVALIIFILLKRWYDNRGMTEVDFFKQVSQFENNNNPNSNPVLEKEDEIVKKIVKEIRKDKKLRKSFDDVVSKINDFSYDYYDVDNGHMEKFFNWGLIKANTRGELYNQNTNALTLRGGKVRDELI